MAKFDVPAVDDAQLDRAEELRLACKAMLNSLYRNCPPGREQSLAVTKLQEMFMWAQEGIVASDDAKQSREMPPPPPAPVDERAVVLSTTALESQVNALVAAQQKQGAV